MANQQALIQQQRQALASAQQQARSLAESRQQIKKSQLLSQKRGIAAIAKTKAASRIRREAGRQQEVRISQQASQFETEVAQKAPEYAKLKFKEKAYVEAKKALQSKATSLQNLIKTKSTSLQRAVQGGDDKRVSRIEGEIRQVQLELGVYAGALKGSKEAIIKGHFTGQTVGKATYERQKVETGQQRTEWAKQQGFASFGEYRKAYEKYEKSLLPITQPGITEQVKITQAPGTYDPTTKSYIDPSGVGMSMEQEYVPKGTQIITSTPSFLAPPPMPWDKSEIEQVPIGRDYEGKIVYGAPVSGVGSYTTPSWDVSSTGPSVWEVSQRKGSYVPSEQRVELEKAYKEMEMKEWKQPDVSGFKSAIRTYPSAEIIKSVERYVPPPEVKVEPFPIPIPSAIGMPTKVERFKGFFQRRGLRDPITGAVVLATDVLEAVTVPEEMVKETKVEFVTEPSPVVGGTIIERPVGYEDVDTGRLPPKQNFELKSEQILIDFNLGTIPEDVAKQKLENAERKFILDESKRTAAIRFAEGLAIGAISTIAPPVGVVIGGAALITGISQRKEILAFAKKNPKAAAIQFSSMIAGGIAGARAVARLRAVKIESPTIKLIGKGRQKFINSITETLEPDFKVLQKNKKITGTRVYEIDIPVPGKNVKLKILEFEKNGIMQFFGETLIDGKRKDVIGGLTLSTGKDGLANLITRVVRAESKGGLTNLEMSTFVERATVKTSKVKALRKLTLTESESKLVNQFKLKGLKSDQVREIFRKPLFGKAEATRRKNQPFTEAEFKAAKGLTKTEVMTGEIVDKIKFTKLQEQLGPVFKERGILDIRTIEKAVGVEVSKDPFKLKFRELKAIIKDEVIKPVSKVPTLKRFKLLGEVPEPLVVKKVPVKPKTPLEVTFAELKLIPKLLKEPKPVPVGALISVAKKIQKEEIKPPISKEVLGIGIPTMVGGLGLIEIPWAGKGVYERTDEGLVMREVKVGIMEKVEIKPSDLPAYINGMKEIEIIKPDIRFISMIKPVEVIKPMEMLKPITIIRPIERLEVVPRVLPALRVTPRIRVEERLLMRQRLAVVPRVIPTRPRPPVRPPKLVPKLPPKRTKFVPHLKKLPPVKTGYGIMIRRKGKWVRVSLPKSFATREGADAFAMDMVQKEAAASYKLVKSKKPAKKSFRKPSALQKFMFRPGKEAGVKVQKKLLRITTPGEVKEISLVGAAARRKKPMNHLTLKPSILKPKTRKKKRKKK